MEMMIRIGDFASMAGVSVATLRLYGKKGLLVPKEVGADSGYRYYEAGQLVEIHRITVLKGLGFTLGEIREILRGAESQERLADLLSARLESTTRQLQRERQKIKQLELQIQISQGLQKMTIADVITLTTEPITVATIHLEIPANDQVGSILGQAYDQIYGTLNRQGVTPKGPCLAVWSSTPDMVTDEVVDACVPVDGGLAEEGSVKLTTLPSTKVAALTHKGPFSEFQACHIVLKEWLAENLYRLAGPYREIYHSPPGDEAVTEVQYPIEAC